MILAAVLSTLAQPIVMEGSRKLQDPDRVFASGIVVQCDTIVEDKPVRILAALDGEVTGTDRGPLTLMSGSGVVFKNFKSLMAVISYDEKLPVGARTLFVQLPAELKIGRSSLVAKYDFAYSQNMASPNLITRPEAVQNAELRLFRRSDMTLNLFGLAAKNARVRPIASSKCAALASPVASNGSSK